MTPPTPIPSHDREPWMQPAIEAFEKIEVPARPDDRGTIERLLMTEMSDRTVRPTHSPQPPSEGDP